MTSTPRFVLLAIAVSLLVSPALAQAPDCTGISDSFPSNSDYVGELDAVRLASGLSSPVYVTSAPGDLDRMFIVERAGVIKIWERGTGVLATPFLAIEPIVKCCGEEGLLSVAFHPDYDQNGYFFIYYVNNAGNIVVSRWEVSGDPNVANAASETIFITVSHQPFSNHNGGQVAFSPIDGHLYIGTGDGGSACDQGNDGQNLSTLRGKMLRLDVDNPDAPNLYSTDGNPFDGATAGEDEIWAYGLRNPFRFTFDRIDGLMMIGDVGQNAWEEVDCQPGSSTGGENYGWDRYEGDHCPNPSCGSQGSCSIDNYVAPIREYSNFPGYSVMAGVPYRGCRMSQLHQTFYYAEYGPNWIRSFRYTGVCQGGPDIERTADLEPPSASINIADPVGWGEDPRGEVYFVDLGGELFKIVPSMSVMELSGDNAVRLLVDADGDFTWENLTASSDHQVRFYHVYRSDNDPVPSGTNFSCVKRTLATPEWAGGDPDVPLSNEVFYYLVTALNQDGDQTLAGFQSDGTARAVDTNSICPN